MSDRIKQILLLILSAVLCAVMISFGLYARDSENDYTIICAAIMLFSCFVFSRLKMSLDDNGFLGSKKQEKTGKPGKRRNR